jgi:K+-transporting ATPase ATPase A chain
MYASSVGQLLLYLAILAIATPPLGAYMARVFDGKVRFFGWCERPLYRLLGVKEDDDQPWTSYALSVVALSAVAFVVTYGILRLQGVLPLNPQAFGTDQVSPDLAYNTSISFVTNTNWQSYGGETTFSHLAQIAALGVQNWASAAVGFAVLMAMIRGFSRRSSNGLGNFWVDVTRATLYVLLPLSLVGAIVLVSQGVPQTFLPDQVVTTMEGARGTISLGPVASQVAIKQLGTNGGGFFNVNSAHPLENPTVLSNWLQVIYLLLIPAALTYTFGKMVGNVRQGWAIFGAMSAIFVVGALASAAVEASGNPAMAAMGVVGGNMEGKEVRFGIGASTLWATATTAASNGSVNSMHDSYMPLGGLVQMFNMMTGEVVFGGIGVGLMGMLMFAVLAVFISGLMVGRTPEYLGKKIEKFEVQMAMLVVLVTSASLLGFSALAANLNLPEGAYLNPGGATTANLNNGGAHGLSEILYAFASATGNNGSAFAGLTANTPFYNIALGIVMFVGRFLFIVPLLALAGSLGRKKAVPQTSGTLPTDTATFAGLLVGIVILVGALTYFPALALGPIAEHFQMTGGIRANG